MPWKTWFLGNRVGVTEKLPAARLGWYWWWDGDVWGSSPSKCRGLGLREKRVQSF